MHVLDRKSVRQEPALGFVLARGRAIRVERGERDGVRQGQGGTILQLADSSVSREHAELTPVEHDGGIGLRVRDLGSRNGTFVDGRRVDDEFMREGSWVVLGGHVFLLRSVPVGALDALRRPDDRREYLGQSPPILSMYETLKTIAATAVPVVLSGPTGTGKEVVSREIHRMSGRPGAFVGVNCGALPENLIESELFGYAKGAFSGANQAKDGLVVAADGGTLLLDEVGDMPPSLQVRLLRVLQEGEVLAVGSTRPRKVDVRVVAASHRELGDLVDSGAFRADLYARLRGLRVELPPVRERLEDVGILFAEGLRRAGVAPGAGRLTREATLALLESPWPLNVRQIMQVAAVAAALGGGGAIGLEHLEGLPRDDRAVTAPEAPTDERPAADPVTAVLVSLKRRKEEPDAFRDALTELLRSHDGNVTRAAAAVGFSRMQVYRWLKECE